MAKKIKFTSKKNPKPSKLARAAGGNVWVINLLSGRAYRLGRGEYSYNADMRPQECPFETKRTPRPQVCSKLGQRTRSMDMGQLQSSNQITT